LVSKEEPTISSKSGLVQDFITQEWVSATPEEVNAVQILARRLVEDYGYDKKLLQTHPQFRVRKRPSDEAKSYPVDIAVFTSDKKTEDEVFIIAECKEPERKTGVAQLKLYMDMSPAEVGVWFNGQEHEYLRKIVHKDGRRTYEPLPNIPRFGQRIQDIGLFKRKDLKRPSNLRVVFKDVRNHLAGMATGITRDEALAQEIINLLFCKIYDEINTAPEDIVTFRSGVGESSKEVKSRIVKLFENKVKEEVGFSDIFDKKDSISLDADSIVYVVGELQNYCVTEADRDAIADAFEIFIGPALRGTEGQFFTPRNVIKMMVQVLDPQPGERIIDPACGSGGFLINALAHVWEKLDQEAKKKEWTASRLDQKKRDVASNCFRGIDKDAFLSKVTKAYMAIVGDGRGGVFCENSLVPPDEWDSVTQKSIGLQTFDVLLTNPPFGKKIVVKGEKILSQYELGHKWTKDKITGKMIRDAELHEDQPPQIIFLERSLQLLKSGGRMGIVLPEAVFGMPTYEYVVSFLRKRARLFGIVSMPEALFKTSGKGGTHAKVCIAFIEKMVPKEEEDYPIFMAEAKWCGHDSRGNPTIRIGADGKEVLLDDVPKIAVRYRQLMVDKA
jgi:type I restriction enzyme M protein